jgi:hypothetical protein
MVPLVRINFWCPRLVILPTVAALANDGTLSHLDGPPSKTCRRSDLPDRILDPMDRISEVLFGLIMALTFTCTLGACPDSRGGDV